jgi:hypothetical protein
LESAGIWGLRPRKTNVSANHYYSKSFPANGLIVYSTSPEAANTESTKLYHPIGYHFDGLGAKGQHISRGIITLPGPTRPIYGSPKLSIHAYISAWVLLVPLVRPRVCRLWCEWRMCSETQLLAWRAHRRCDAVYIQFNPRAKTQHKHQTGGGPIAYKLLLLTDIKGEWDCIEHFELLCQVKFKSSRYGTHVLSAVRH